MLNNSLTVSGLHLENSKKKKKVEYPLYNEKIQGPFVDDLFTGCSKNEHKREFNVPFLSIKWDAFLY